MCGRFALHSRDRIKLKGLTALDLPFEARYNIAPTQQILAIGNYGKGHGTGYKNGHQRVPLRQITLVTSINSRTYEGVEPETRTPHNI